MKMSKSLSCVMAVLALFLGLVLSAAPALAVDRVTLKDGKVLEGTIVRELEGIIWLKYDMGGIEREQMLQPSEITSIERDAAATPANAEPVVAGAAPPKIARNNGAPRAAVITLGSREGKQGDMVGVYMTAHGLKEMIPMLEEELGTDGTGIVVFRITSGGGLLLEIQRLSDVIQNEYKKRWRVVAWIDSAISAAAMTAHCIEDIYFTPQGNYGACTGWSGALVAVKGRGLEEVLYMMEKISARGGYDHKIMRAMQIQEPLSCTIDPNGNVSWFQDATSGEILVNRDGEVLTFNADTAAKVKFSKGTASTVKELEKLMGYQELEWVGVEEKGVPWKVCKAEKWNIAYRKQVHQDEERVGEYFQNYNMQIQAAAQAPRADRGAFVNRARQTLEKIKNAVRTNPNFALLQLGMESEQEYKDFIERQEKQLRDLMR
jgi:hypothetical protein